MAHVVVTGTGSPGTPAAGDLGVRLGDANATRHSCFVSSVSTAVDACRPVVASLPGPDPKPCYVQLLTRWSCVKLDGLGRKSARRPHRLGPKTPSQYRNPGGGASWRSRLR